MKKLNKFISMSIIISVLFLLVGIILIVYPEISLKTIAYIIGGSLIVSGIFFMFESSDKLLFMSFLSTGVLEVILGLIIVMYPNLFRTFVPILIGIWMVVKSSIDCKISLVLRSCDYENWFFVLSLAILSIACGIMIIFNPKLGSLALTTAIGTIIIIYSITNVIDAFIFKSNVRDITKHLGIKIK